MSWGGGGQIYDIMIDSIDDAMTCDSDKQRMATDLIEALEDRDWQGLGEIDIDAQPSFVRSAIYSIHTDWE